MNGIISFLNNHKSLVTLCLNHSAAIRFHLQAIKTYGLIMNLVFTPSPINRHMFICTHVKITAMLIVPNDKQYNPGSLSVYTYITGLRDHQTN